MVAKWWLPVDDGNDGDDFQLLAAGYFTASIFPLFLCV